MPNATANQESASAMAAGDSDSTSSDDAGGGANDDVTMASSVAAAPSSVEKPRLKKRKIRQKFETKLVKVHDGCASQSASYTITTH